MPRISQPVAGAPARELLVAVVLLAVLVAIVGGAGNGQYTSLACTALIYAIACYGLTILYGTTGLLSMAQVGLMAVGGFTAAYFAADHGLGYVPSILIAAGIAAVAGAVVAVPSLRAAGHYFLIVTFLVTASVQVIANNLTSITGGVSGISVPINESLFGYALTSPLSQLVGTSAITLVAIILCFGLRESRWGQLLLAIRENERLGNSLGLKSFQLKVAAFAASGLFAGLAGGMYAMNVRYVISDDFDLDLALTIVTILLIGGARRLEGPLLGGFLIVFLPQLLHFQPTVDTGVNGVLLMAAVLALPDGIAGGLSRLIGIVVRRRRSPPRPEPEQAEAEVMRV